jgi:hypothetical protein
MGAGSAAELDLERVGDPELLAVDGPDRADLQRVRTGGEGSPNVLPVSEGPPQFTPVHSNFDGVSAAGSVTGTVGPPGHRPTSQMQ